MEGEGPGYEATPPPLASYPGAVEGEGPGYEATPLRAPATDHRVVVVPSQAPDTKRTVIGLAEAKHSSPILADGDGERLATRHLEYNIVLCRVSTHY